MPDLAESLGKPSDDAKTWTYTLRKGVKFEDGTPVTSKDVKYAVERSLDKTTFPNGPTYFNDFLDLQGYTSPTRTRPGQAGPEGDRDAGRPDDHLPAEASRSRASTTSPSCRRRSRCRRPRTPARKYKEHVVSTGPYMFETNELGKSFTLVRNPNWDPATDPNRKPLPDRIEVALNVNADDIDNRLLVRRPRRRHRGHRRRSRPRRARSSPTRTLKANTDNAPRSRAAGSPRSTATSRRWTTSTAARRCSTPPTRPATSAPTAAPTGGDIATNLMPPLIPGAQKFDLYAVGRTTTGDLDKAKDGAAAVRAAQRLHHQHLLPRRAARRRRRPPRRCSSRWPGSASS